MRKPTLQKCIDGKDHLWEYLAETTQALHEWCEICGAYKRSPVESERSQIHLPSVMLTEKLG